MAGGTSFVASERLSQGAFLEREAAGKAGHQGAAYRLPPDEHLLNLAPAIRAEADPYFDLYGITRHRHLAHGLSSQACCLNFLMPLARRPELLSRLIGAALDVPPPQMRLVENGPGGDWYVGFEWIGEGNPLGEWPSKGRPTRGANVTSADAVVKVRHADGVQETVLIEWKYTEAYGPALADRRRADGASGGHLTRTNRYAGKAFHPDGPVRDDLGLELKDFFWEPFYQLLRQQMLAWRLERAGQERVRVLHISPRGNLALHKVTAPKFADSGHADAFDAFKAALAPATDGVPRFISVFTEDLFGPLLQESLDDPWAAYLLSRYEFLGGVP